MNEDYRMMNVHKKINNKRIISRSDLLLEVTKSKEKVDIPINNNNNSL